MRFERPLKHPRLPLDTSQGNSRRDDHWRGTTARYKCFARYV